jgi:hypothetical protein
MQHATESVVNNHLQAARQSVDAVMKDFNEESVLITNDATYKGLDEIRQFYSQLLNGLPDGFFDAYNLNRMEVVGEVAYILWEAKPWFPLATDTFVVRNGKFAYQTFAVYKSE